MPKSTISRRSRGQRRGRKSSALSQVHTTSESPLVVVPKMVKYELKYYSDSLSTFGTVGTTDVTYKLFDKIGFGTGVNQRIGQIIQPKALTIMGTLVGGQSNLVSDDIADTYRLSVVVGSPGLAPSGITVASVLDPRYTIGVDHVLYDKVDVIVATSRDTTGYMSAVKRININVDLSKIGPIVFAASLNSVKNQEVYVVMVTDSALAPNPGFANGLIKWEYYDN
jgi:hypothetical protein